MAQHKIINPDPATVPLLVAQKALDAAQQRQTHHSGSAYFPIDEEHGVLVGAMANDGISDFNPTSEEQKPLWEGISQDQLDQAAENILNTANTTIENHVTVINNTLAEQKAQIEANTAGVQRGEQLAQAAQAKADQNAAAIDAAGKEFDAYKTAADKAMDTLDQTVQDHGSVLDSVQSDLTAAKQDLVDQAKRVDDVEKTATTAASTASSAQSTATAAQSTADNAATVATAAQVAAKDAKDNTVVSSVIEYAIGGAQSAPTSGWTTNTITRPAGATVWMRTRITRGDGTSSVSSAAPVTGDTGPKGDNGTHGISITAVTDYYALASTMPAKPNVREPGAPWSMTEPDYERGKALYTSSRVDYSDATWTWTAVQVDSSYAAAQAAQTAAQDAQQAATNAQTASTSAQTAAQQAAQQAASSASSASSAAQDAADAKSDAATAKTDASQAKADAATAKSTADGASKVATQSAATATAAQQAATSAQTAANLLMQTASELQPNPGFEAGQDYWTTNVTGADFVQESTQYSHSGTHRAALTVAAGTKEIISTHAVQATVGQRYRMSCWYKLTDKGTATAAGPRLQYSTDGKAWADVPNCPGIALTVGDDWRYTSVDAIAGEQMKYLRCRFAFDQPVGAFLDDFSLKDITLAYAAQQTADQADKTAQKAVTDAANADAKAVAADQRAIDAANAASDAQDTAKSAFTTADSKNRVFMQATDPREDTDPDGTSIADKIKPGDLWWKTSTKLESYWEGEPNNSISVLVDHSDEIEEMKIWNGTEWVKHVLYAQDMLVNGSVVTELLAANSITAEKISVGAITADALAATALYGKVIKGGQFLSGNERMALNDAGFLLKDKDGDATITMNSADGSATFRGVLIIDGSLTAPVVAGGTIRGASYQVTDKDDKVIGTLNADGIAFGDSLTYAKKNGAWQLTLSGAIQAGGEIKGAKVTGCVVQTSSDDNVGIKLTDDGLVAYNAQKLAAFTLTNEGQLMTQGAIMTNSNISAPYIFGGTIEGTTFQTGPAGQYPRAQFDSTALRMWDDDGNQTVYLDGQGKSNLITGSFQTKTSGERVYITPDYSAIATGGEEAFTGQGLIFVNPAMAASPQIAGISKSSVVGDIAELDFHSGYLAKGEPGAFGKLRSGTHKSTGRREGAILWTTNTEYSEASQTDSGSNLDLYCRSGYGAQAGLNSWSPSARTISTVHSKGEKATSELRVSNLEETENLGVQLSWEAKRLYMGGKLGGWHNGYSTFLRNRVYSTGSVGAGGTFTWDITWSKPAAVGKYYPVGTAESTQVLAITYRDVTASGCKVQVRNTGSASASPIIINTLGILDD